MKNKKDEIKKFECDKLAVKIREQLKEIEEIKYKNIRLYLLR